MLLWMHNPSASDESIVGGKMATLAQLSQREIPVPHGFTITSSYYTRWLNGDNSVLVEIESNYLRLGGRVAVRSSAIGEDGADNSFAGQFETVLGVEGGFDVVEAVKSCWRSANNTRSTLYRDRNGIGNMAMCVGIIELVAAKSAGVAFSRHPVTGGNEVLIEATHGWGEALVSGQVTPDMFTVAHSGDSWEILDADISNKENISSFSTKDRRITLTPMPVELAMTPSLAPEQVLELGALVSRMEHMAQHPVDVEWVLDEHGKFVIVQQRPITTL